jgi:F0F1-type ATP synthase membrane subunit b/b'
VTTERGPYMTPSRYLQLERLIASTEARILTRVEALEEDLAAQKRAQLDVLRAQVGALMGLLREQIGTHNRGADT